MDTKPRTIAIAGVALIGLLILRRLRRHKRFHEFLGGGGYNDKIQHNPSQLYNPSQSYTHVVISRGSHPIQPAIIMISGQVAFDENKNLVGGNDKKAQARKAFMNLRSAIESSGATANDVVKINVYIVDYKEEDIEAIQEGCNLCFGQGKRNFASTILGVQALARPNLLIEVEAMAIINSGCVSKDVDKCSGKMARCGGGWGRWRGWGWGKKSCGYGGGCGGCSGCGGCGGGSRRCDKKGDNNSNENSGNNRSEKDEKVNK